MKKFLVIFLVTGMVFCCLGQVKAEETSDLKNELDAVKAKVNSLEQQLQQKQEPTVCLQRLTDLESTVTKMHRDTHGTSGDAVSISGHLKLYMFDQSDGKRNGIKQHNPSSAGVSALYLYIRKHLSDMISLEVSPEISVSASATPSLGSDITRATSGTVDTSFFNASMLVNLEGGYELKVGQFNPIFSEEYGRDTWWEELYHMPQGMCYVQSWHDMGLELYKSYEFDEWSLPVYLYLLNGNTSIRDGQYSDNNEGKTVMIHVSPELLSNRLRLLGSLALGKWDSNSKHDSTNFALGFDWNSGKYNLRSEYCYKNWQNYPLTGRVEDAIRQGYYIQGAYWFTPKWRGLVRYSEANNYKASGANMLTDDYDGVTVAANYFITDSSTIILQVMNIDGFRSDNSEKLEFYRTTLGWRTTF